MDVSFWKSRRVFLTGHTGFKGSWLALWLHSMGAEVCGYSLEPSTEPSLYRLLHLEAQFRSIMGDIRELGALVNAMRSFAPEVVIHMAAQPLVRLSYEIPVETYAVNVLGTVHVLEAVRQTPGVRAVVVVTSDKCYENREWPQPYREHEAMGGHDPYSSSKGCAELVTSAYRRSFFHPERWAEHGVAVASARAGNVIGGGDWAPDRLVPDIVRAWAAGEAVVIRNPEAVRPWQHVLEPLSGYLTLAERLCAEGSGFAEGWNFGPADGDARPVRYVLTELARLWNGNAGNGNAGNGNAGNGNAGSRNAGSSNTGGGDLAQWQIESAAQLHEAHLLRLESAKARARLGWAPRWNLDETLAHTVEWYKGFYRGEDVRVCSLRQIEEYMRPMNVEATGIASTKVSSTRDGSV
jgi:CDP-glucose 4,6-dehydratase